MYQPHNISWYVDGSLLRAHVLCILDEGCIIRPSYMDIYIYIYIACAAQCDRAAADLFTPIDESDIRYRLR